MARFYIVSDCRAGRFCPFPLSLAFVCSVGRCSSAQDDAYLASLSMEELEGAYSVSFSYFGR